MWAYWPFKDRSGRCVFWPLLAQPLLCPLTRVHTSVWQHMALLNRLAGVVTSEVRTVEQLESCDALVIPGGESTTMALIAEQWGLLPALQQFANDGNPVWGTCAGLIFLANRLTAGGKKGGQKLIGGLDVEVHRNFFGAQIDSFEAQLPVPPCLAEQGGAPTVRGVFIRAPAIIDVGPGVEVLATYTLTKEELIQAQGRESVIVAVRSKNLMATSFHPELTNDIRWHQYFVDLVRTHVASHGSVMVKREALPVGQMPKSSCRAADMPVY
jgi:pyridoxal 5'-phosphate synthase pdxT subunit